MNVSDIPTTTLDAAPVDERLHEIVRALLADGINVYVYQRHDAVGGFIPSTWLVIERDGNTGTVQVESLLGGFRVFFDIQASRETGSSLVVVLGKAGTPDRVSATSSRSSPTSSRPPTSRRSRTTRTSPRPSRSRTPDGHS